jgi:two-component system, response regulator PdtaR
VKRQRLLIGEDQVLIRLDLHRLLERAGFDVCAMATDGEEAVRLALELRPDLVLLDVKMPGINGIEAARRILAELTVPIVLLTAYGHGELISHAVDVGVAGLVSKPFRESDLLEALDKASRHTHDRDGLAYLRVDADDVTLFSE